MTNGTEEADGIPALLQLTDIIEAIMLLQAPKAGHRSLYICLY